MLTANYCTKVEGLCSLYLELLSLPPPQLGILVVNIRLYISLCILEAILTLQSSGLFLR